MGGEHLLAEYLQARRRLVTPRDVGLLDEPARRRVVGLRREEVARLAGISGDYYLRMEQGRELHPSAVVIEGLARALRLDPEGLRHLHRLARPPLGPVPALDDSISSSVTTMIESMPSTPLHLVNRYLSVLYANPIAQALSAGFRPGNNLVAMVFHPAVPRDSSWRRSARRGVASLRASVGPEDEGPEITDLLAMLHRMDPVFTELWDRHDIVQTSGYPVTFDHPSVGTIEVRFQTFTVPGTGGQRLGLYLAAPDSPSAEKLELLSLSARSPSRLPSRLTVPRLHRSHGASPEFTAAHSLAAWISGCAARSRSSPARAKASDSPCPERWSPRARSSSPDLDMVRKSSTSSPSEGR